VPEVDEPPPPPPRPAPYPPLPPKDERGIGLLITGSLTFGVTYLFTSLGGAITIDDANAQLAHRDDGQPTAQGPNRELRFGRRLLVPVFGPFAAIRHADSAKSAWGAGFSGLLQAAGVAMIVAGAVRHRRYRRARRLQMSAGPTLGGAQLTLIGHF
jgi:hypothetical protein